MYVFAMALLQGDAWPDSAARRIISATSCGREIIQAPGSVHQHDILPDFIISPYRSGPVLCLARNAEVDALVERIIGVAAGIEGVKSTPVVVVEGEAMPDPQRQVRIRKEISAEGYGVRVSIFDNLLCRVRLETAGGDDFFR